MKIGIKIAKEASIDSSLIEYYYFTGVAYAVSNVDSALIYLKNVEKLARRIHQTKYIVRSEFELLNIYHKQSKTDSIAPLMQSLKNESSKLDSLSWEKATLLKNLGYTYYWQLKYNESLSYFFKALHICLAQKRHNWHCKKGSK
jgi:tetratricopeptide (TPR) repeat protein